MDTDLILELNKFLSANSSMGWFIDSVFVASLGANWYLFRKFIERDNRRRSTTGF